MKKHFLYSLFIGFALLTTACNNSATDGYSEVSYYTFTDGELERPTGYRTWVYVGTPTTPNDMNNGKAPFPEFHNVYIDPVSYDAWKETGQWREGTILIKELVSVDSKAAASGNGYFMGNFIGLEATIKSKELFPNEPGNWAYFSFTNPGSNQLKNTAKAFATNQCNSCHDASAQDDFVFTQYYPVLREAKNIGKGVNPENSAKRQSSGNGSGMTSEGSEWDPTAPTPSDAGVDIPLEKEALFAYLNEGSYRDFATQEKEKHPSLGPHTKIGLPVKVYMNDAIANSLAENKQQHPKGSIIVKEMFDESGTLSGWAVMAKTHDDTDSGKGWFWYEVTSTTDANSIAAMGNGVTGCITCHNIGNRDMVRTSYPFQN